ncbi:carcinoembryonic antigen-related cell adhesion molecule 5-like isoform X2 [Panonychus citri]|uniref:carcinoembryonic antigen-related cell adhesion molecule 5-like isoform X2 n=1 Tax=Panonychus citri TaxID=50023 RepID=UPI002307B9D2|nr:carcinoembryonic antigen-related cell adhesion molecule 5-like isoform X2 [Panonychus citri]
MKFQQFINSIWLINCYLTIQLTLTIIPTVNTSNKLSSNNQDIVPLQALNGTKSRLNCKYDLASNDSVTLILWYRKHDATGPPFYTIDARNRSLASAGHVISSDKYTGRVEYDINQSQLIINPTIEDDGGNYTCRVDFKNSRTRYTLNRLQIQVPPKNLVIEEMNSGKILSDKVGPYNENSTLILSCRAYKGQPLPYLEWYIGDVPIKSSESRYDEMKEETYTRLELFLERKYDKSQIKCVANLKDFFPVLVTEITIQLNLAPLNTSIHFYKQNFLVGDIELITCQSFGSKPQANLTWFIEDEEDNDDDNVPRIGTSTYNETNLLTTSTIKYDPTAKHNGKNLICKAINSAFPDLSKQESIYLNVHHKPNVHLTISDADHDKDHVFREGEMVRMICNTSSSNPGVTDYKWYQEDKRIYSEYLNGETLTIPSVSKDSVGKYYCSVRNTIDSSRSNSVHLNILYAPQCNSKKIIYAFRSNISIDIKCEMDANPREVTFTWIDRSSNQIPSNYYNITSNGLTSYLTFNSTFNTDKVFICSAENSIGKSKDVCVFTLTPAAPPDRPDHCKTTSLPNLVTKLRCKPGKDNGVDQNFIVIIHPGDNLSVNIGDKIANANPDFDLKDLQPNRSYYAEIYSENELGRSESLIILFVTNSSELTSIISDNSVDLSLMSMIVYPAAIVLTIVILLTFFITRIHGKTASYKPSEDDPTNNRFNESKSPDLTHFPEEKLKKDDSIGSHSKFPDSSPIVVAVDSEGNVVTRDIDDNVAVFDNITSRNTIPFNLDEQPGLITSKTYLITDKNARNREHVLSQVSYSASANKLSSMVQDIPSSYSTPV